MLRSSLTIASILACASALRAQTPPVVRHVHLSVAASDSIWTSSGVVIKPGDVIAVRASGLVTVSRYWFRVDADGVRPGSSGRRGSEYLEARVGIGHERRVGTEAVIEAADQGLLRFRVHDTRYDDNQGALHIDVLVVSADSIPEATVHNEIHAPSDLPGVLAMLKTLLDSIATIEDGFLRNERRYINPFWHDGLNLPEGITADSPFIIGEDDKSFTMSLRHVSPPAARCAIAVNMRNPINPGQASGEIACEWRNLPWMQ